MPPNLDPIVSTGRWKTTATDVPASRANIVPGTLLKNRAINMMRRRQDRAKTVVGRDSVDQDETIACNRGARALGTCSMVSPKKSLICVLAMTTAIPFVNPITTGRGMNFTALPRPVAPRVTSKTPAMIVHMNSPSTPCFCTMPATTTTNAPVGPPICVLEPPKAEMRKPAVIAQ